jgi:hypothetical protein
MPSSRSGCPISNGRRTSRLIQKRHPLDQCAHVNSQPRALEVQEAGGPGLARNQDRRPSSKNPRSSPLARAMCRGVEFSNGHTNVLMNWPVREPLMVLVIRLSFESSRGQPQHPTEGRFHDGTLHQAPPHRRGGVWGSGASTNGSTTLGLTLTRRSSGPDQCQYQHQGSLDDIRLLRMRGLGTARAECCRCSQLQRETGCCGRSSVLPLLGHGHGATVYLSQYEDQAGWYGTQQAV